MKIKKVVGMQVIDSRGNPTVEATVVLENGKTGTAIVPSGASTGAFEAVELRDESGEYGGKSVFKAVHNVNDTIAPALQDFEVSEQYDLDMKLLELDGTENKGNLGANATLAVSLAAARAAANAQMVPLYKYLGGIRANTLPVPMMNILNGGKHADNNVDIQEFMIMPKGARNFEHALQMGTEIYHTLKSILKGQNLSTAVGDEGGFAPNLASNEQALELLINAIETAGYRPGEDVFIALDVAASEIYDESSETYYFEGENKEFRPADILEYYKQICSKYPIISVEDPFSEDCFMDFAEITKQIGNNVQIVGDDLFVTNNKRLAKGITLGAANAILIKPNQIGTLSETMEAVRMAQHSGYKTIISHRSGETEDTTIADIAVGLNAGQIKTGAPCRSDRVAKYNQLLRIERFLGKCALFGQM